MNDDAAVSRPLGGAAQRLSRKSRGQPQAADAAMIIGIVIACAVVVVAVVCSVVYVPAARRQRQSKQLGLTLDGSVAATLASSDSVHAKVGAVDDLEAGPDILALLSQVKMISGLSPAHARAPALDAARVGSHNASPVGSKLLHSDPSSSSRRQGTFGDKVIRALTRAYHVSGTALPKWLIRASDGGGVTVYSDEHLTPIQVQGRAKEVGSPFPIDFVVTWVDPYDMQWRKQVKADFERVRYASKKRLYHEDAREPARPPGEVPSPEYRDEGWYCVHTAAKFAPWLHTIWIVCQRPQRPWWLPASGKINGVPVKIVYHDEIFDKSVTVQPTYSSNVIESQIGNIADLAEAFIYSNDDFFFGRPVRRQDFFKDDGTPVLRLHDTTATVEALDTVWGSMLRHLIAVGKRLGVKTMLTPEHTATAMRKSTLQAVVRGARPEIKEFAQFRSASDFPVMYLAVNMQPRVDPKSSWKSKYYNNGKQFLDSVDAYPHLLCINHHVDVARPKLDAMIEGRTWTKADVDKVILAAAKAQAAAVGRQFAVKR
jgi:hypothetical protein